MNLLIYTDRITSRVAYIIDLLIKDIAGFDYKLTEDWSEYETHEGPGISYSSHRRPTKGINVFCSGFLYDTERDNPDVFVLYNNYNIPYPADPAADWAFPFDVFAAAFYLVSRCEEYDNTQLDQHRRFSVFHSMAYKNGFLEEPVVNQWGLEIRKMLLKEFRIVPFSKQFSVCSTIDIDQALAIKAKGFWRTVASWAKQLFTGKWQTCILTFQILLGLRKDPYDSMDYILSVMEKSKTRLKVFLHLGNYGRYDKAIRFNHPVTRKLAQQLLEEKVDTGLHPSYYSSQNISILKEELNRYFILFGKHADCSRQHYLRFKLPETFQRLIKLGIKQEYSMGYSERIGFRAGICTPYRFYDLEKEQVTDLLIYPFCIMDRALKDGMKLSLKDAKMKIDQLKDKVQSVEGMFIVLFHNESLSDNREWKNWRSVYEYALDKS